ncbi:MAG: hypothetical protein WKG32_18985 [Gemmatimonadaceae bacterium]
MHHAIRRLAGLTLLVIATACARNQSASTSPRTDWNLITEGQLGGHRFGNAYEAVQALRNGWLQTRGPDSIVSPTRIWVYLDNSRLGGVESLRSIAIPGVAFIQHFDGVSAAARWGLDHGQGVIYVSSRP